MTDTPSSTESGPPKGTLYCPTCDHESPTTGDWIVREQPDREVYECPACGATVTIRPRFGLLCH